MRKTWWSLIRRGNGKYLYFVFLSLLLLVSISCSGISDGEFSNVDSSMGSQSIISKSVSFSSLALAGIFIVICIAIATRYIKIRKANSVLKEKNERILKINKELESTNIELTKQKDIVAREYHESGKFSATLLQSASDGISFFDKDWRLMYANNAFYSSIGHSVESYLASDIKEIIHPDNHDYLVNRAQAISDNGFYESEIRLKHIDGNYLNFSTRSVAVRIDSGEVLGTLTIMRDITKLKQVHDELIIANVEAETSNNLKANFLANISHEIRTPLNSVVGFSNLLLSNNLTKEVKEEYIEHINHNSEKLLQIIGDIIDLSRLASSQIEIAYEETSLSSVINEIIEDTRQDIKRNDKPIILNVKNQFEGNSDLIFTDRIWLKRVLSHLMDNAVKFTLEGSVEFSYILEDESMIFRIKDTGIGINKENLAAIFEEFRQEISGHHRPFEGLGIGLTLAKEVVERMGGKIFVESEKGLGSEFSFSLPYRPAGSSGTKMNISGNDVVVGEIRWSHRKCLLVDDNKDVLIYLSRILVDTGVEIITARSGFEAIEIIKNTPDIDVVLLDMQMPEMNGIEATKEIRKIRSNLPIIAQTAFIYENDKDIILEAGCDACLIKPIRKDHLLTVMSSFVR